MDGGVSPHPVHEFTNSFKHNTSIHHAGGVETVLVLETDGCHVHGLSHASGSSLRRSCSGVVDTNSCAADFLVREVLIAIASIHALPNIAIIISLSVNNSAGLLLVVEMNSGFI